jgi:threonine/homoserine/homoserine lactone efflux protein
VKIPSRGGSAVAGRERITIEAAPKVASSNPNAETGSADHGPAKIFGPIDAAQTRVALAGRGYRRLFRDGFIVNLLNPKTALFLFAFLPQFVDLSRGHVSTQIIVLGLIFALLGLISDGCYALLAGTAGSWLRRRRSYLSVERYVSGTLFIGLGLTTAFAGVQKK